MKPNLRLSIICHVIVVAVVLGAMMPVLPVLAAPTITASPSSGACGTKVMLTGTSFYSYIGDELSVFLNDIEIRNSGITVSAAGALQATFIIPVYTSPGGYVISIRLGQNTIVAQCLFTVSAPKIVLDKWEGIVGTEIKVSCRGFTAEKEVTIQYYSGDSAIITDKKITNNSGECTDEFEIPASPAGANKIVAYNARNERAEVDFIVIPSVTINPAIGAVGDLVTIIGTGFAPVGEAGVSLYGRKVAYAQIYKMGSFCATFYVPAIKAGNYTIQIEDPQKNMKWIDFTVDARITLDKTAGEVDTTLKVEGTGFEADDLVSIQYDLQEIARVVTDDIGAFSYSFDVPVSTAGLHIIIADDGFNIRQATFTMESEAPLTPKTSFPKNNAKVESMVSLDWESVYDPSQPLTYTLQIARTSDFSHLVLEKTGLTESRYTLSEAEALMPNRKFTSYYWRVRATDGASNVGDWSEATTFRVNPTTTLPVWAKYLIGTVGVLIIILAIYRVRKAAYVVSKDKAKS
ncbi:MAG: hypothetical protein JW856_01110 [Dehalococcoidales bacterium]|nr:hypothetical protein [Dehalococcoidales bacterium]